MHDVCRISLSCVYYYFYSHFRYFFWTRYIKVLLINLELVILKPPIISFRVNGYPLGICSWCCTRFGQRYMSRVLQVFEIFEIWICCIFELCWLPKVTNTLSKRPTESDHDGNNNQVYIKITVNFYILVYVRRSWYGS